MRINRLLIYSIFLVESSSFAWPDYSRNNKLSIRVNRLEQINRRYFEAYLPEGESDMEIIDSELDDGVEDSVSCIDCVLVLLCRALFRS